MQLLNENKVIIKWHLLTNEFNLERNMHFHYIQLVHAVSNTWKSNI